MQAIKEKEEKEMKEQIREEMLQELKNEIKNELKKEDLDEEEVDENEAREFAKSIKAKFSMASAKNNGKGFIKFLEILLDNYITKNKGMLNGNKDKLNLDRDSHRKNVKNKKCC